MKYGIIYPRFFNEKIVYFHTLATCRSVDISINSLSELVAKKTAVGFLNYFIDINLEPCYNYKDFKNINSN